MNHTIQKVIVIPSYNETLALAQLLKELVDDLLDSDAVMIMDDSPVDVAKEVESACRNQLSGTDVNFYFFNHNGKSGRGSAVRRGFEKSVELFPDLRFVIECDADGSHQAPNQNTHSKSRTGFHSAKFQEVRRQLSLESGNPEYPHRYLIQSQGFRLAI